MITLMEKRYDTTGTSGGKTVKARGHAGRVALEGNRRGFTFKKPSALLSRPQPSLNDWMMNLSQQLGVPSSGEDFSVDRTTDLPQPNAGSDLSLSEHVTVYSKYPLQFVGTNPSGVQDSMEH
ncbi:hypothetical protein V6N13_098823 [Hibiscus sabdariffa]|uniref:Uncharacterized protein n=1 Tax=Hibiscus sabdariffa TaxID=183260 RepID=A0ABR2EF11_9ROSI